jgi:hypothetical protein
VLMNVAWGDEGQRESTMRVNRRSHRNGPNMDPWPGPKRGVVEVFW